MPSNTSQAKSHGQGSAFLLIQASKLSEDRKSPGPMPQASKRTTESHQARKMSGNTPSYAMHRWLQEKPEEQPWSISARVAEDLANVGTQDAKNANGVSKEGVE